MTAVTAYPPAAIGRHQYYGAGAQAPPFVEDLGSSGRQVELACMNCVCCCNPQPFSLVALRRETERAWAQEKAAHEEALRSSHERYCSLLSPGTAGQPKAAKSQKRAHRHGAPDAGAACCGRAALSLLLPMIVLRSDGSMVQFDAPPAAVARQGKGEERKKVSLNSLYRDCRDSVSFKAGGGSQRACDEGIGELVDALGLRRVRSSGLRERRGQQSLGSLLLPMKMTNVSVTAKVENFVGGVRAIPRDPVPARWAPNRPVASCATSTRATSSGTSSAPRAPRPPLLASPAAAAAAEGRRRDPAAAAISGAGAGTAASAPSAPRRRRR